MRGPWQGTVRCKTSENAVVCIQPVRECSGLRVQEEGRRLLKVKSPRKVKFRMSIYNSTAESQVLSR
jgi:hypothetical protein